MTLSAFCTQESSLAHSVHHNRGDGHDDGDDYQGSESPFLDNLAPFDAVQLFVLEDGCIVQLMMMVMVVVMLLF